MTVLVRSDNSNINKSTHLETSPTSVCLFLKSPNNEGNLTHTSSGPPLLWASRSVCKHHSTPAVQHVALAPGYDLQFVSKIMEFVAILFQGNHHESF